MTAEDFLQQHSKISHYYDEKTERMVCFDDDVKRAMIDFAKFHVKAALKAADEAVENEISEGEWNYIDDKNFVINSYPLKNVK